MIIEYIKLNKLNAACRERVAQCRERVAKHFLAKAQTINLSIPCETINSKSLSRANSLCIIPTNSNLITFI